MRTVCILNNKGGVGKTTTTVNMAAILAKDHKQRVLVIDADSQGSATEFLGGDPALGGTADAIQSWDTFGYTALIQPSNLEGVDLLCGSDSLMDLDLSAVAGGERVNLTALRSLRYRLEENELYDAVLVDCPPCFNAASSAALVAAGEVIIPVKLDAFALRGMTNLLRQVAGMRRLNEALTVSGCLVTQWYDSPSTYDALVTLAGSGLPIFDTRIRRSDKVDGMTFAQQPLVAYSPRSAAGVDYRRFVREWLDQKKEVRDHDGT